MNPISFKEALERYPFLRQLAEPPEEVVVTEINDGFLNQSFLEEQGEALGHAWESKTLFVVQDGALRQVNVQRVAQKIYPPEYLHPGMEFPADELGSSEALRQALSREDMSRVDYVVLHHHGCSGGWYPTDTKPFNKATIGAYQNSSKDRSEGREKCPKCGGELRIELVEHETAAGDYVNEYRVAKCLTSTCSYKHEECIGGHCSASSNLF